MLFEKTTYMAIIVDIDIVSKDDMDATHILFFIKYKFLGFNRFLYSSKENLPSDIKLVDITDIIGYRMNNNILITTIPIKILSK